jgi:hypothetical protein
MLNISFIQPFNIYSQCLNFLNLLDLNWFALNSGLHISDLLHAFDSVAFIKSSAIRHNRPLRARLLTLDYQEKKRLLEMEPTYEELMDISIRSIYPHDHSQRRVMCTAMVFCYLN